MKGFTFKTEGPGEFVNGELITQGIDESTQDAIDNTIELTATEAANSSPA